MLVFFVLRSSLVPEIPICISTFKGSAEYGRFDHSNPARLVALKATRRRTQIPLPCRLLRELQVPEFPGHSFRALPHKTH